MRLSPRKGYVNVRCSDDPALVQSVCHAVFGHIRLGGVRGGSGKSGRWSSHGRVHVYVTYLVKAVNSGFTYTAKILLWS